MSSADFDVLLPLYRVHRLITTHMGLTWASEQAPAVSHDDLRVEGLFSPFEKLSLKLNLSYVDGDSTKLLEVLGVQGHPGSDVLLRMGQNLTHDQLKTQVLVAIGWFDGRIPKALRLETVAWHLALFQAMSSAEMGGERYVSFEDVFDLVRLSLSAFDIDPQTYASGQLVLLDRGTVLQLLRLIKVPAVEFERLNLVFTKFPFAMYPLGNIWRRLLVDRQTIEPQASLEPAEHSLTRARHAVLYSILGPSILNIEQLYRAHKDGFSMHTLEAKTSDWARSSLVVLRGRRRGSDERKMIVLYVDSPWRPNMKRSFGGDQCMIVQLEPEIETWRVPVQSIFMSRKVGIGAGIDHPPRNGEITHGTLLLVPIRLNEAVLKHVTAEGRQVEERITVDQLEVLGCGAIGPRS